jgi:hypothetical protein
MLAGLLEADIGEEIKCRAERRDADCVVCPGFVASGKLTRLGILFRVAASAAFPDGVQFIEINPVTDEQCPRSRRTHQRLVSRNRQ